MGNSAENSELTASVADVLWLFAALFDGPPPAPLWVALRETVWPHLRQAVDAPSTALELPAWDADRLGVEYDQWLAIPVAGQGALGYPPERVVEQGNEDSVEAMARLADLLGVEWEKPSFRPGSAFPVRPDHLTVLWGLWAILLTMPGTDQLGERRVEDWSQTVWSLIHATLTRLQEILPAETAYAAITRIALAYGVEAAAWQEMGDMDEMDEMGSHSE